jgi:hypothetical protein
MLSTEWEHRISKKDKDWIEKRLSASPLEINIQLTFNYTPLIRAVQQDLSVDFIRFLLENGADVNSKNKFDDTAFSWAMLNSNIEILKLLVEYGTSKEFKSPPGHPFRYKFNKETLCYLMSIGVSLEGVDYKHDFYKKILFKHADFVDKYLNLQSPEFIRWYKSERMDNLFE